MITLGIIVAVGALFLILRSSFVKNADTEKAATKVTTQEKKPRAKANPVTKAIVSEAMDTLAEQQGGTVKEAMDSMSEEDKDAVAEIIASNVSLSSIPELKSYADSKDSNALMEYAKDNFSEEDVQELTEILQKYDTTP